MNMKRYFFNLMLPSVLLLSSCTERIDIELDNSYTRLVVYGEVTTDTLIHTVKLTTTSDYYYNEPAPPVSNAIVELREGANSFLLTESPANSGIYETTSDFFGIPGKTYHLNISNIDINKDGVLEEYSAESYLPPVGDLDSIKLKYTENSFFSGWEVLVYAWDNAYTKDYYSFKVKKNRELLTDTLNNFIVQSDDLFNGNYTYGITSQFLNDDSLEEKAIPGDSIIFEINGITYDYFVFIIEAQNESSTSTPLFNGPPANISSNISNGALGFFTAYSIKRAGAIVPDYPEKN
jgi:Domain of unknown function (DUF4249)